MTDPKADITDAHTLINNERRRVDIARRSFDAGDGVSHTFTIAETRGGRRIGIDLPVGAIDATIDALIALRAAVVAELGEGSTSWRGKARKPLTPWTPSGEVTKAKNIDGRGATLRARYSARPATRSEG